MNTKVQVPSFRWKYAWLSNFAPCKVYAYPSVEHAYVASKTLVQAERRLVLDCATPAEAKRLGRRLTLRPDWEEKKLPFMLAFLRVKFEQEPYRSLLLETGDSLIEEGNTWGDTYWGICQGKGENHLGKLIMQVRAELTHSE